MATLASNLSARLWLGGTYTRWIPSRSFTVSSSVPPLPSFSQRDDNVGSVNHFLSVLLRALRRARHFALVESSCPCFCSTNQGSLVICFRSGQSVRPMHLFGQTFDHDYYFELPREGERDTQSIARCSTSHHGDFRAFPRTNRTCSTARNSIPSASSSTGGPRAFVPWRLWRSSALVAVPCGSTYSAIPADSAPSLALLPPAGNATASCLVL